MTANTSRMTMGLKTFRISGAREALELICDGQSHDKNARTAWIDSGSLSANSLLATTIGWNEVGRNGTSKWLCPRCSNVKPARPSREMKLKTPPANDMTMGNPPNPKRRAGPWLSVAATSNPHNSKDYMSQTEKKPTKAKAKPTTGIAEAPKFGEPSPAPDQDHRGGDRLTSDGAELGWLRRQPPL